MIITRRQALASGASLAAILAAKRSRAVLPLGGPNPFINSGKTNVSQILGFQHFSGGKVGGIPSRSNPISQSFWNLFDGGNSADGPTSSYSTDFLDTGFSTVMKQTIAQGADGEDFGATWGWGFDWDGGGTQMPALALGDELWSCMRVFCPTGFNFGTSDGALKLIRFYVHTNVQTNVGYTNILWGTGAGTSNNNWIQSFEGDSVLHNIDSANANPPPTGAWTTYDYYVKYGTGTSGLVRFWINKVQVGSDLNVETMLNTTDLSPSALFGTFWNGGSPQAQNWYTSMTAVACNSAATGRHDQSFLTTDTNGKPLIALGF